MPALPVFPTLAGRGWSIRRRSRWANEEVRTRSGRVFSVDLWSYPVVEYQLTFEFLREDASWQEATALLGFFDQVHGRHGRWYYTDEMHSAASAQQFGLGDGSRTQFAIGAPRWGQLQPIGGVDGSITVTVAGGSTTAYSLVDERILAFNTAPGNGQAIAWTGSYFERCKFVDEYLDAEHFAQALLSAKGVRFETVKP